VWIWVALTPSAVVKSEGVEGPVRIARLAGQGFKGARDAGQLQCPCLHDD